MARDSFTREFEIDLEDGNTVAYKGCIFEIVKVDNATIKYKVLKHFHIRGHDSFSYLWNVFIYLNAFSQKVCTHKRDIFVAQFSTLYFPLMAPSTSLRKGAPGWCSW